MLVKLTPGPALNGKIDLTVAALLTFSLADLTARLKDLFLKK